MFIILFDRNFLYLGTLPGAKTAHFYISDSLYFGLELPSFYVCFSIPSVYIFEEDSICDNIIDVSYEKYTRASLAVPR